ncbi:Protein smg8, partial [Ataeniobius toweri]|nr:Protein smg8 [Ataeniobius toweri]
MAPHVNLGALLQAEFQEDVAHREDGLCVVGIFGKSSTQTGPLKGSLINTLADKHIFSLFGESEEGDSADSHIEAFYDQENRVLYLLLSSICDSRQLLRACRSLSAGISHSDAHDFWKGLDRQHCLHLLYMFSVCHVLLLVHPSQTFDVTHDRLFRALDALRQKVLPLIRAAIKDCAVSKEWKLNCRPCPPRLLFVFQMTATLKVSGNGSDSGGNPDKPKKHSPRRRLQHALEDQIYRIFRKSRVLTNQSSNCLFTVPANQAFVYVIPAADKDPVGTLLGQLRSNCILSEQDTTPVLSGPRRYQQMRRSARQPSGESTSMLMGSQLVDCSLKEFLWQHVELVLTKKGFDDSVGRNPQPSHFELPTYTKWVQVASRLYQVLITNTDEELAELATKVQSQVKVLDGFLDADTKFSENRCQKALPLAHSAYQSNLPHNYTTTVHKNQLAQALRVYSQHARGVAFQRYALQLHEDCYKFWSNGHQLCEERSLTDQHCVHKFHLLPQPDHSVIAAGEKPDMDHNPPIMNHNSRGRSTSSCNCGRKQAPREDPFDIQAANYDFYQ